MARAVPDKLKPAQIGAFANRANQLERHKPIITYWLRFYIVQKIISSGLHSADAECNQYTTELMESLEKTKAEHPHEDALLDEVAAYAYCEQFALQTFAKGDREMSENRSTKTTADTLLAASTFLEMLAIWKKDPEPDIKSKQTYAKFHAVRILKALRSGEDPNLTNPVHEPEQPTSPPALEAGDPEVQALTGNTPLSQQKNPFQSYVESAPDTNPQPSPTFSAPKMSPPNLPSAPTGYSQSSHRDVSPISQPTRSREGSVASIGGGYFPRVDVPTFTAENAPPSLPTAQSTKDEPMTSPFEASSLPSGPQLPQAPQVPDPQSFYTNAASPPQQQQQQQQPPPTQFQPPPQPSFTPSPAPPQQYQYPAPPPPPPQQYQGPFKTDEDAVLDAQKHAKWAISALNFEDVNTAVKELRIALRALGAN